MRVKASYVSALGSRALETGLRQATTNCEQGWSDGYGSLERGMIRNLVTRHGLAGVTKADNSVGEYTVAVVGCCFRHTRGVDPLESTASAVGAKKGRT